MNLNKKRGPKTPAREKIQWKYSIRRASPAIRFKFERIAVQLPPPSPRAQLGSNAVNMTTAAVTPAPPRLLTRIECGPQLESSSLI